MKNLFLFLAMFLAVSIFWTCQNTDKTGDKGRVPVKRMDVPSSTDTSSFMHKAAIAGKMEVELGQIAAELAKSPEVKDFGAMMVRDHTRLNMELESLAVIKKYTLPTVYPNRMKRRISDMKKLNGKAFEKRYMSMMVEDHLKFHALFEAGLKDEDPQIRDFAKKALPLIKKHDQQANAVRASLNKD